MADHLFNLDVEHVHLDVEEDETVREEANKVIKHGCPAHDWLRNDEVHDAWMTWKMNQSLIL